MVTDLIERIRAAVKLRGVTALALSQRAGLHRNTLIGIHNDDWNPTADTLKKLEPLILQIEAGSWEPDEPTQVAA